MVITKMAATRPHPGLNASPVRAAGARRPEDDPVMHYWRDWELNTVDE